MKKKKKKKKKESGLELGVRGRGQLHYCSQPANQRRASKPATEGSCDVERSCIRSLGHLQLPDRGSSKGFRHDLWASLHTIHKLWCEMTKGGSMKLECIQDCMTGVLGVVIAVCTGCLVSMSTSSSAEAAHEMQQESLTPLHLKPQISYSFASNYQIMWADDLIKVYDAGNTVEMALDQTSGTPQIIAH